MEWGESRLAHSDLLRADGPLAPSGASLKHLRALRLLLGARLARQAAAADGLPGGYGELVEPVVGSRGRACARVTAGFALGECCPPPGARGLPAPAAVATAAAAAVLRRFGCRAGLGAHLGDLGDGFGGDLVGDFLLVGHFAVDLRHRSEEHTSELQSRFDLVCRLLLEKKKSRHGRL